MNYRPVFSERRRFLMEGLAGAAWAFGPRLGPAADEPASDPLALLIRLEVRLAEWLRRQRDPVLQAPPDGKGEGIPWADYGFKWPAYTLVHLWSTKHPDNPLFGADWCPELAMELYDKEVSGWAYRRERGGRISTYETPHYVAAYLLETLGKRIGPERRKRWLEHEEAWVTQALVRPLGQTGRYHDSWRFTALYRLGKVLDQPKWTERGIELFHQMLKYQVREGFWVEQRGPSARYHGLMLPSLAWMYRWTGDEAFGEAARRLVRFLTRFTHPDAISVGPFDVRNCNVMAYFPTCGGLELTAEGRVFSARAFRLWNDLGMLTDARKAAVCTRDLARMAFYVADTCRYLSQYAPRPAQVVDEKGELPIDRDGMLENHTTEFDGMLVRKGAWVSALSSQSPDGPRQAKSPYMLDGQSRLELWHSKARLVVGGGHSHRAWAIPVANVFLGAGEFGKPAADATREARNAACMPREARTTMEDGVPLLTLKFPEGTFRFRILVKNDRQVEIAAEWQVEKVPRLSLQLPLVVWRGAELLVDGAKPGDVARPTEVKRQVEVRGGPFAAAFTLRVPEGAPCRVHYPLATGQFHDQPWNDDPVRNPYDLALVSSQWTAPAREGKARFVVALQ